MSEQPDSSKPLDSSPKDQIQAQQKIAIIVDANAIIKQIPLRSVINKTLSSDEEFNKMYEIYTLQDVVNEIRDE